MLLLCIEANAQNDSLENIVFEGAGIRGLAYSGAIAELEAHGVLKNIKRVGGTSAGAITALLLCLNYSATEISETIQNTPFQKFNSGRFFSDGGMGPRIRRLSKGNVERLLQNGRTAMAAFLKVPQR